MTAGLAWSVKAAISAHISLYISGIPPLSVCQRFPIVSADMAQLVIPLAPIHEPPTNCAVKGCVFLAMETYPFGVPVS